MIRGNYRAAGGVVWDDADRVLVLDRPSRGEVRLPKGHIEPGETPLDAARREVAEESGYDDFDAGRDLGEYVIAFDYQGRPITRSERYFAFRLQSPRRVERGPKDAAQFIVQWLPLDEALAVLSFEAEREWVRRAASAMSADPPAQRVTPDASEDPPACPR